MRVKAFTIFFDGIRYLSQLIFFDNACKIKVSLSVLTDRTSTQRSGKMQHLLLFFFRKFQEYFLQLFLDRFHLLKNYVE